MKCLIKINNKYKRVKTKEQYCNHFCDYFEHCIKECGGGTEHFPERDTRFKKKPIKHGHLTTS